MSITSSKKRLTRVLLFALTFLVGSVVFSGVRAEQDADKGDAINVEELIQKIKREIMKELREGDFLRKEIDIGIQRYVDKQREAQRAERTKQARISDEKAKNIRRVSKQRDHIYGNPDAEISLIEYSDFECPFCKRFHQTPKQVVDNYGGKVNWVYRHFPLSIHNPGAQKQAEASECAGELGGNDAFWKYANALYLRTKSNGNGFPINKLVPLAKEMGLNEAEFQTCLQSERYSQRVQEDLAEGSRAGITGTPGSILLHNRTGEIKVLKGAVSTKVINATVARMLRQQK